MTVFVITHKKTDIPTLSGYVPLLVGSINKTELHCERGYIFDDNGENISDKNDSYCELTGLYWIWKNCSEEYIGLTHYRRFFSYVNYFLKTTSCYITLKKEYDILSVEEIFEYLKKIDLIVRKCKAKTKNFITFQNGTSIGEAGWNRLEQVIKNRPQEEQNAFERYKKKKSYIGYNMFVGKKSIIDKYCSWLFEILDEVDNLYIQETGKKSHNRELGYMGEFLFGVWLDMNRINYKAVDVMNIEKIDGMLWYPFEYISVKIRQLLNRQAK